MNPRVTFVLVTYGGGPMAARCLEVLAEHTDEPYEVVVVDSASPDGTGQWLQENLDTATVVRLSQNLGFGAGCNVGVEHAGTEFVCFLNADVEVTEGWLPPLLEFLDGKPEAAAVAPLMVFPDGRVQEAGSLLGGDAYSRGWGDGQYDVDSFYPRVVDYASAACLVMRRKAFYEVGGFSPEYHIAYYEDTDLQFMLRRHGWQVWVQPASRVLHVRHGTSSTATAERLSDINREVFRRRHSDDLATRPPALGIHEHTHRLWWLRDRPATARILVVAGEDELDAALLTELRDRDPEAAVTLFVPEEPEHDWRPAGIEVVSDAEPEPWSRERVGLYDVVIALGPGTVAAEITEWQPQAVRVLRLDVLPHVAWEKKYARDRKREDAIRAGVERARLAGAEEWAQTVMRADAVLDDVLVDCGLAPAKTR
ncbi:glycosyltransferase family 2 protein [Lentzea californiensis]|uniref:glycosyltransferase family 2 protein n=1 Tax=Lentzea californiensis TaxID=438851 RepID=UPI00216403DE|nr:glycosyltransferase family 2 protein [Lentzea californiensis]MCR3747126.1 Glycosyltransferase, GT2 family [Lentzea californiensis]